MLRTYGNQVPPRLAYWLIELDPSEESFGLVAGSLRRLDDVRDARWILQSLVLVLEPFADAPALPPLEETLRQRLGEA